MHEIKRMAYAPVPLGDVNTVLTVHARSPWLEEMKQAAKIECMAEAGAIYALHCHGNCGKVQDKGKNDSGWGGDAWSTMFVSPAADVVELSLCCSAPVAEDNLKALSSTTTFEKEMSHLTDLLDDCLTPTGRVVVVIAFMSYAAHEQGLANHPVESTQRDEAQRNETRCGAELPALHWPHRFLVIGTSEVTDSTTSSTGLQAMLTSSDSIYCRDAERCGRQ